VIPLIRKVTPADALALVEIERESFPHPHWSAEGFLKHDCILAEVTGQIAGFLVSRQTFPGDAAIPPEREILNLAVAPHFRRMKIATALLKHELSRRATHFLEVRESNLPAQKLYRDFGFIEISRRPNYYEFPLERAIVMKLKWC
jgi:[ribosomal protein S18]-alanine N-acetyltransferase